MSFARLSDNNYVTVYSLCNILTFIIAVPRIFVDIPQSLFTPCNQSMKDSVGCHFAKAMGIWSLYFLPLTITMMIFTNIYTVHYFWWFKRSSLSRHSIYMGVLSISDLVCLIIVGGFWFIPAKGVPYATNGLKGFFTYNIDESVCKTHRFLVLFSSALACNIFLLAVFDRCLAIYFPLTYGRLSNSVGRNISLATIFATLGMSVPFIFLMGYNEAGGITFCWLIEPNTAWQIYSTIFFNCGTVQSCIIIGVNVALIVKLLEVRNYRKTVLVNQTRCGNQANSSLSLKEIRMTVIMVIMSSIYALCSSFQIIGVIFGFYSSYIKIDRKVQSLGFALGDIGYQLFFCQMLSNWFVYMTRIPQFKVPMLKLLNINWNSEKLYAETTET